MATSQASGKKLLIIKGEIQTPPMSQAARREAGMLLRELQNGVLLSMPQSRPMPSIGARVHELRIVDADQTWRVIYRIDPQCILILEVFSKKTPQTPEPVVKQCRKRLREYDAAQ
jgi:phage-related protein